MYNKFKQITQIDNNGCQSIFSYLQNKISMIENTELVKVVISIKHYEDSTIIYEFKKGTIIPLSIFKALKLLFTDFKLLDSDFNINLTVNFYNKTYDIYFIDNKLHIPEPVIPLFDNFNLFNFLDGYSTYTNYIEIFEKLFEFLLKKDFTTTEDTFFIKQLNIIEAGEEITTPNSNKEDYNNQFLLEKLIKEKNDLLDYVNTLNKKKIELTNKHDSLKNSISRRDDNLSKYESLKLDLVSLQEQQTAFYKAVQNSKNFIKKIEDQLVSLISMLNDDRVPESEKTSLKDEHDFYLKKKSNLQESLSDAEVNLKNVNSYIQTTKEQMSTIYDDLSLISDTTLPETTTFTSEIDTLTKEIEESFLTLSDLDNNIELLEKNITSYNITKEYKDLKNSNSYDMEILKNNLAFPIYPNSLVICYKYLYKLFQYYVSKSTVQTKLTKSILDNFHISTNHFFEYYDESSVIIK